MDFLIMFIPLMFFAAAKRAATFTPTPSQEEILAGARGSVGDPGTGHVSYAVEGPDLGCQGTVLRNTSGSFAILAAIRRASSFVSSLAAERRPGLILEIVGV